MVRRELPVADNRAVAEAVLTIEDRVDDAVAAPVRASERVTRALAIAIGCGGIGYGLLAVPEIVFQGPHVAMWWNVVAVAGVFGSSIVLALVAVGGRPASTRACLVVVAVAPTLACATFPLASDFAVLDGHSVWIWRIIPLGAIAVTMLARPAVIAAFLAFSSAVAAAVNCYATGEWTAADFVQYFVRGACYASVFTWALGSGVRAATLLDQASDRAERSAARAAANAARARERDRFAALIHDGVLSTLLDASRGQESKGLARQASTTLVELDAFRSESSAQRHLGATATIDRLRSVVHDVAGDVRFSAIRSAGSAYFTIPIGDFEVVVAAATEAIRNSVRHAGSGEVGRDVEVAVTRNAIRVRVIDDGSGFDYAAVQENRLGLPVSILGRMRALAGGAATVDTIPGHGTIVTLVWEQPNAR